ncbi:MAG TPA: carbohydrate porin, partial [Gemmataceae bacterium]
MRTGIRRAKVLVWAVLAADAAIRAETVAQQDPAEYPVHLFQEPFPRPVDQTSNDFRENYFFGDWFGLRAELADHGIKPLVLFITDPFVNVTGGRRQGFSEYDLLGIDLLLETDKLLCWPGGEFHVGFANNSGTSLSKHYVGNNFPIQLADVASPNPRLTYLSYAQSLLDGKLSVRFGRLTINSVYGEEFAASPYFKAFTSVGFDLVPQGIFFNAPGAFGYPLATWGARVKFQPLDSFYAMAGCYNGDPDVKDGAHHGVDFSFRGPPFVIGEVGFRRNYGKDADGFAGNAKFGAWFNGGSADVFGSGQAKETELGRYGFYVLGDQVLARWGGPAEKRHMGVFASFVCAPDERVNQLPYFFDAGLVAYGFLPSRPRDFAALAFVFGSYSSDLRRAQELQAVTDPSISVQSREM